MKKIIKSIKGIVFMTILMSTLIVSPYKVHAASTTLSLINKPSTVQEGGSFNVIVKFTMDDLGEDGLTDGLYCDVTSLDGATLTGGSMLNMSTGASHVAELSDAYERNNIVSEIQILSEEVVQTTLEFDVTGEVVNVGNIQCYNQGFGTTAVTPGAIPVVLAKPDIATKTLPDIFTAENSKTTDLDVLTKETAGGFKGFILEVVGKAKVKYTRALNLSDADLVSKIEELDEYVILERGSVEVKVEDVSVLDNAATITMYGLNLNPDEIELLKDGKVADVEITDVIYDPETLELSFKVSGFSKYQVGAGLKMEESFSTSAKEYTIRGSVSDYDATITATINGETYADEIIVKEDGTFEFVVSNEEGDNEVIVTATSVSGAETEKTVTVTYGPPDVNTQQVETPRSSNSLLYLGLLLLVILGGGGGYLYYRRRKQGETDEIDENGPIQPMTEDAMKEIAGAASLSDAMGGKKVEVESESFDDAQDKESGEETLAKSKEQRAGSSEEPTEDSVQHTEDNTKSDENSVDRKEGDDFVGVADLKKKVEKKEE